MLKLTVLDKDCNIVATATADTIFDGIWFDTKPTYPYFIWRNTKLILVVSECKIELWDIIRQFKNGKVIIQNGYAAPEKGTKEELEKLIISQLPKTTD